MCPSKKSLLSLINVLKALSLYIAVLFLATSCIRGANKGSSQASGVEMTADFMVDQVSGKSISTSKNNGWNLPDKKTYQYRACLVSRATNAPLPIGQKFALLEANGSGVEVTTDNLGCINWKEAIPFNFSSNSVYLEKKRRLESRGTYQGATLLHYAVNPWLEFRDEVGDEVVDLSRGNTHIQESALIKEVANGAAQAGLFTDNASSSLYIEENPKLHIYEEKLKANKSKIKIVFRAHPFINPLKMNGEPRPVPIMSGRFKIYAQLLGKHIGDKNESLILTPELKPQEVKIQAGGLLSFDAVVPLGTRVTTGQVQLALKIVPLDAPFTVSEYEGLHQVGEFAKIYNNNSLTEVKGVYSGQTFSYTKETEQTSNFEELKKAKWVSELPAVNYSHLQPRFAQVMKGETSTERTVIYRVSTRVTRGRDGAAVANQPFKIILPDGSVYDEDKSITDDQGMLYWTDTIFHKYYEREHRIDKTVTLIHKQSKREDKITIALNPWDEGWTFGADLRTGIRDHDFDFGTQLKPNLLMVDAFRYQTIRFLYDIDEFLTLKVKKAVVMALDPLVQRDTLYRGRIFEPLRDGVYLAKIALVKKYMDPFQNGIHLRPDANNNNYKLRQVKEGGNAAKGEYTTVIKKLLRVQAGRITTPLEFSMRDLRMMSIRSYIMLQLETIDENALMRDNIVADLIQEASDNNDIYNDPNMSEADKKAFLEEKQRIAAEKKKELEEFLATTKQNLEESREASREEQIKRDKIATEIEAGKQSGSIQSLYREERPLISLPRLAKDEAIARARANMSEMELYMKQHWGQWEQGWSQANKQLIGGEYVLSRTEKRRTYGDYLAVMQAFMDKHGIDAQVSKDDYARLALNNYTQNPIAPLIDLNLYRNKSGLLPRAFIGPCTLVANDNQSEMRPTDTVDEKFCKRIDCSELIAEEKERFENTKGPDFDRGALFKGDPDDLMESDTYRDSLKEYKDMKVDVVIDWHKQNEIRYRREMKTLAKMGNFVQAANLDYVSLADKKLEQFKEGCTWNSLNEVESKCFEKSRDNTLSTSHLLSRLNGDENLKRFDDDEDMKKRKRAEYLQSLFDRYFYVNPKSSLDQLESYVVDRHQKREEDFSPGTDRPIEPLLTRLYRDMIISQGTWAERKSKKPSFTLNNSGTSYGSEAHQYVRSQYGQSLPGKIRVADIQEWLKSGTDHLKLVDALRICDALATQSAELMAEEGLFKKKGFLSGNRQARAKDYLLETCFSKVRFLPDSQLVFFDGVAFDRRHRVIETGEDKHIIGRNMNINVGMGFGIGSYSDLQSALTKGVDKTSLIGLGVAAGIGAIAGAPVMATLGVVGAISGWFLWTQTATDAAGVQRVKETEISAATFLVVQKAEMELEILSHEKCLATHFPADLINELDFKHLQVKDETHDPRREKLTDALTRGFMICSGEPTNEPETVKESYYYITQHFTAGDMLDENNLLNHAWLLALRGDSDFNRFIGMLNAREVGPKGERMDDSDLHNYPLSRLGHVYNKVLPSFPGIYSVPD